MTPHKLIRIEKGKKSEKLAKLLKVAGELSRQDLLSPFVRNEIIPPEINLILPKEFFALCASATNQFFLGVFGWYVSREHCYADTKSPNKVLDILRKEGIDVSQAVLLDKRDNNRYPLFIHEALHYVFNNLSPETRNRLLESARTSYSDLTDMFELFHCGGPNITQFIHKDDVIKAYERRGGHGAYLLSDLSERAQLYCLDEFISYFFADSGRFRYNPKILPNQFKNDLESIGYRVSSAPVIVNVPK